MTSSSRRFALSLSTWFCMPEHGMKQLEILVRSSASIVRRKNRSGVGHRYHVLTSSHVVAPWKWPKYYASEWHWLAGVNESHTHYTVELRHSDGMFLTTADLAPASFHHAHRDVAVMHFDPAEQAEALDTLAELGYRPLELPAPAYTSLPGRAEGEKKLLRVDDRLRVFGHEVEGTVLPDGTDLRRPYPRSTTAAAVQGRSPLPANQLFVHTTPTLVLGMCGGPVLREASAAGAGTGTGAAAGDVAPKVAAASAVHSTGGLSGIRPASRKGGGSKAPTAPAPAPAAAPAPAPAAAPATTSADAGGAEGVDADGQLVGVVEGIVPTDFADPELRGRAVVVEVEDIEPLLDAVDGCLEQVQRAAEAGVTTSAASMEAAFARSGSPGAGEDSPVAGVGEAELAQSKALSALALPHGVLVGGEAGLFVGSQLAEGEEDGAGAGGGLDVAKVIEQAEKQAEADEAFLRERGSGGEGGGGTGGSSRSNFPV